MWADRQGKTLIGRRSDEQRKCWSGNRGNDFVLWMFLSVFTVWMEKVASVNCVWAWMGGMGKGGRWEGGKMGRCHYGATLPSLCLGHKRLLKKSFLGLNLQVKQINIARSAKVVLHKLPGESSLNVSFVFPVCPAHGHHLHHDHHNQHDRVRFPKKSAFDLVNLGPQHRL